MIAQLRGSTVGLLLSGGLDSSILLGHLLDAGTRVQPIYVRTGFFWQGQELSAARRLLSAMTPLARSESDLEKLVVLDMPVADLYDDHWSITGRGIPDQWTKDEAVYLPGHNALLILKAALWCQMRGILSLALASLATNPFADATTEFFDSFQVALNRAMGKTITIVRPFDQYDKTHVMRLGERYPLELTFSCLAPVDDLHCGRCNKCAERRIAFQSASKGDPTSYAAPSHGR